MYKLFLTEGEYTGKSTDGSWKQAPNIPIIKMEYYYTMNRKLVLQGYKEYNHLVEKIAVLGKKETIITKIFIYSGRNLFWRKNKYWYYTIFILILIFALMNKSCIINNS